MAFPGSAWKYVPSSGVPNPPRCATPSRGGFAPESASGAVCSHERAAALAEVGECGARSGCLTAVGGFCLQTDDRGSRRRASGLCAATVAGGSVHHLAYMHGNACASHFHRRSFGPPTEHTCARVELSPSNGARLPAELKHITKRRKRNQQGCP